MSDNNKKHKVPQSIGKVLNYFEDIRRNEEFLKEIEEIRKMLNVPLSGFEVEEKDIERIKKLNPYYYPRKLYQIDPNLQMGYIARLGNVSDRLLKDVPLDRDYKNISLSIFVFHNKFLHDINVANEFLNFNNSIAVTDTNNFLSMAFSYRDNHLPLSKGYDLINQEIEKYPVILKISPESSQRDIRDFISKNFYKISGIQKLYRKPKPVIMNKKTIRRKDTQRVKDLIYKNKRLPISKIVTLLKEQKVNLVDAEVSSILKAEKKRREQEKV